MSLLNDKQIMIRANQGMITPFCKTQVRTRPKEDNDLELEKVISYGVSSAGYDLRLDRHIMIPSAHVEVLDPKAVTPQDYDSVVCDEIVMLPGMTILGTSVEYFTIPNDVHCLVVGKSTYARIGVHVLTTPAEPGWFGKLTIEISNLSGKPAKVYTGEGICQMLFFQLDSPPAVSYSDRNGKYNGQTGVTIAKV